MVYLNLNLRGLLYGVVDERGEISAMHKGVPQNDLGIRTDVLNNIKKSIGIEMLVRSMAPKVVIADEIGNEEDVRCNKLCVMFWCKGIIYCSRRKVRGFKG